jgi:HK97 family phage prohead protease
MTKSIERRFVGENAIGLEERSGEATRISGYAAVFYDGSRETEYELWPGVFERIAPEAFDNVLEASFDTRCLMNHDPNLLLGRCSAGTLKLEKFSRGLKYTNWPGDTGPGRDAVTNLRRKDMTGSSFSFVIDKEEWQKDGEREIRTIRSVSHLYDVGPVTFPAYEGSSAGLRAMGEVTEARSSYERWKAEVVVPAEVVEVPTEETRADEPTPEQVQERLAAYAARASEVQA